MYKNNTSTIKIKRTKANFPETLVTTPKVNNAKNITNSKGLLTGFLNLTIDKAPIIPNDNAMSFFITVVITRAILGNKT